MSVTDWIVIFSYLMGIAGCHTGIGLADEDINPIRKLWLSLFWPIGVVAKVIAE